MHTMDILNGTKPVILTDKKHTGLIQTVATLMGDTWYVNCSGALHAADGKDMTFEQYKQNVEPSARLITWEEWEVLENKYLETQLTKPVLIDEGTFYEALEVLPPCRWHSHAYVSLFHVSERIHGRLVNWYAKADGRYWEWVNYCNTPSDELSEQVRIAAREQAKIEKG